jgi:predicted DNA-binding transcriptional regulator AlpA
MSHDDKHHFHVGTFGEDAVLLDKRAVAKLLGGCSVRHVDRLAQDGRMPAPIKLGSLVRWSRRVIEDWIAGGCQPVRGAEQ